jgi:hypothetical protein
MPDKPGNSANVRVTDGRPQGGDVQGTRPIDVSQGEACEVANASFDPGYEFGNSLPDGITKADLVDGYCGYGKSTGEK